MKNIIFEKISIRNFLSVGEEPLEIDFREGFNVITGINRDENGIKNGIGKTLIIDALYFAIFSETLRALSKKEFIVNRKTKKNCVVELSFSIQDSQYKIVRSLAPSACRFYCNGADITLSTMPETNNLIQKTLSADETLFQNCIVMRANATVPFMAKKEAEKKNFIESIFRLEIFSDMQKKLKENIRQAKKDLAVAESNYTLNRTNIDQYNREISRLLQEAKTKDEEITRQVEKIRREIRSEKQKIEDMKNLTVDIPALKREWEASRKNEADAKKNFEEFLQKKYQLETTLSLKNEQLRELSSAGNVCPTCKREYTAEHKAHVEKKRQELTDELRKLNAKKSKRMIAEPKAREILKQIASEVAEKENSLREAKQLNDEIKKREENLHRLQEQLNIFSYQKQENSIKSLENLVAKALKKEEELEATKKECERELTKMTTCEHILGEYGVRSYIVGKLLGILNERIDHYLTQFQSLFHFTFNEVFEEKIVDSNGVQCQYGNCSGAESKKIDLAIAFAFSDVLKLHQRTEYNLIFFDEILDSSLDSQSLSHVMEFLHTYIKENNKAAYLITHKTDLDLPQIDETILLEKKNGLTYRLKKVPQALSA